MPEGDAMAYLQRVADRAKELYALSDQGPWEALPEWMQASWIEAAKRDLAESDRR